MGAAASFVVPLLVPLAGIVASIFSPPARSNPTLDSIRAAERERAELEARVAAAQAEADRLRHEAEEENRRAQRAEEEARVAQEEQARARRETEDAQRERERVERELQEQTARAQAAERLADAASRIAQEELRRAQAAQEEAERQLRAGERPVINPTSDDVARAKAAIGYKDGLYHFAVAGVAGSGKSSLINALRGLSNREAGAAKTGVTETTLEIGRYQDRDARKPFVWYDIPGAGTFDISDWQYFHDRGLYVFDAILVLIDNRFTMTDIAIITNCARFKIPCYLVRSKADVHIRNVMLENGYDEDDDDVAQRALLEREATAHFVEATRQNVKRMLERTNLKDQRVYVISNKALLGVVQVSVGKKMPNRVIDEVDFLRDLLGDAYARRGPPA